MALYRSTASVTPHRFFLSPDDIHTDTVTFPPDRSHQIRTVLRLQPGDHVVVLDGTGNEMSVRLQRVQDVVTGTVENRSRNRAEPATCLVLYQGLLKASKLELILQKATEIGVCEFVPLVTARAVSGEPGPARQKRFEAIVREAAEQSRRGVIPAVTSSLPYSEALGRALDQGPTIILWEGESDVRLGHIELTPAPIYSLFVGPEGGLTETEVREARHVGAITVTLSTRILRAETAAIVGAGLLLARLDDFG